MMPIPKAYKIGLPIGIALWALIIWSVSAAFAQSGGTTTRPTWFNGATQNYISTANPLPVSASVSASITGFPTIQSTGTPISVTTGGVTGTLPAGAVVVATNAGATNNAFCKLGASATTSDQLIAPTSWFAFTVGANTQLTCITSTSTTTVNMVGGTGLPTGAGGGGGGAGGSSAITTWAGGTLGAMANYGTSPGAVLAPGMNAFVTNTVTVSGTVTSNLGTLNGASTAALQPTNAAQGAAIAAATGNLMQGSVTTGNPSYTTATINPLSIDANGGLRVNVIAGGAGGGAITAAINSYAAGALSAGAFATGAGVDGWDLTQGAKGDSACATDTGSCSIAALAKRIAQNLTTLNTTAGLPASLAVNVTPTDCSATVVTGGTAVNAFTAQTTLHGFTILNDDTSEVMWISFTTTAAASTAGSYPLAPATATSFAGASSFTSPPGFGTNHALSVIAATSAHKFSCTWW